jgi:glycosyltransferase involved in cell wall biosynthesis
MNPLVSIVIPCYKAELFIAETIQSIINQTYANWELIIIDDGSPDNQREIIKPFLSDVRIQYHYQNNAGVSAARNKGLELSKGDFIAFLDADDLFLPFNLEKKVAYLLDNNQIGLVHAIVQDINEHSKNIDHLQIGKKGWVLEDLLIWEEPVIPAPSSILMPTKVVKEIGGWNTQFQTAADQEFFIRVAKNYEIGMINEILTCYRELPVSMSTNITHFEKDHINVYNLVKKEKLFKSKLFEHMCYGNLYLTIAGSWWHEGHKKMRALYFVLLAFLKYPPALITILNKIIHPN